MISNNREYKWWYLRKLIHTLYRLDVSKQYNIKILKENNFVKKYYRFGE